MKAIQSRRIFIGILTCLLCVAGTILTIANHWPKTWDVALAVVAIALAAAFSACELVFLMTHKEYERANKLRSKITIFVSGVALVISMSLAVYAELTIVFEKKSASLLTESVSMTQQAALYSAKGKNERAAINKEAMGTVASEIGKHISNPIIWPFVLCYALAGIVSMILIAAATKEKEKRPRSGNMMEKIPGLNVEVQKIAIARGVDPTEAMAYSQASPTGGKGYTVHAKRAGYIGFVPASRVKPNVTNVTNVAENSKLS